MRRQARVLPAATQGAVNLDQTLRDVDRRQSLLIFKLQETALGIEHRQEIFRV